MRNIILLFAISFCILPCAKGNTAIMNTTSSNDIKKIIEGSEHETLILIDVKSVLIMAKDKILYPSNKKHLSNAINAYVQDSNIKELLWSVILAQSEFKVLDPKISELLENAQKRNTNILALTSGNTGKYGKITSREDLRIQNLKSVGIDFMKIAGRFGNIYHEFEDLTCADSRSHPMIKNGIIFTCKISKSLLLQKVLKYLDTKPQKIIFVDNTKKHLEEMAQFCATHHIEFQGIHYTKISQIDRGQFDKKTFAKQFNYLTQNHKWLSDEQASQ